MIRDRLEGFWLKYSPHEYQEYRNFCQRTGEYTRHNSDFSAELEKRGFQKKKTRKGAFVMGVTLKDEAVLDFED